MARKYWIITGPPKLDTRQNPLASESAIAVSNNYCLSDAALQMRQGFASETYSAGGLDGPLTWIARHVASDGSEEAWASSNNAGTAELARRTGSTWAGATFSDTAAAADLSKTNSASQNGKLFLAYNSDVNRLHVWDGTTLRRVGLAQATAPTVASIGAGALGFTRYYRQRNTVQVGGVTVRRSEASSSVNITIAASSGVRVTKGAASGDGETHWEVEYADAAAGPWYRAATTVVGTTTYDDTAATISTTTLTDTTGLYYTPPSAKYIVTDGGVLLMAGAWETSSSGTETAPFQNRVWFTRPLGATDISDDESITQTSDLQNWIDIGDAGAITGLVGPMNGEIFVFKVTSVWKLVPTGDVDAPYQKVLVSDRYGCSDQRLATAATLSGIPAICFADYRDVYAIAGTSSVQRLSGPIGREIRTTGTFTGGLLTYDTKQRMLVALVSGGASGWMLDCERMQWSAITTPGITSAAMVYDPTTPDYKLYAVSGSGSTGWMMRWSAQAAIDRTSDTFTTSATYRRTAGLGGQGMTLQPPTVWYRKPGTRTVTFTVRYTRRENGDTVAETVTMADGTDNDATTAKQVTLESLMLADAMVADVAVSMVSATGAAGWDTQTSPSIDAIVIPYDDGSVIPA